ncbi:MAG TPA: energy transducer TonB [Terriglobales bacterium]|nr:energy transducer TonB [Terriglobales bacterium]
MGNKLVFIRGFYIEDQVAFNGKGDVVGQATPGAWTLSLMKIKKIKVGKDELRFEGLRGFSVFNHKTGKFEDAFYKNPEKVRIAVAVDAASLSAANLEELVNRVLPMKLTAGDVPEYWRDFFLGKATLEPSVGPGEIVPGELSEGSPIYRAGQAGDVAPPKVVRKSEPAYTDEARSFKLQGTIQVRLIVNKDGSPENIQIVKPLGLGLDDEAVRAIQKWRFKPGSLKGVPVATLIDVEVDFRLY